jgi:hypothetical protein
MNWSPPTALYGTRPAINYGGIYAPPGTTYNPVGNLGAASFPGVGDVVQRDGVGILPSNPSHTFNFNIGQPTTSSGNSAAAQQGIETLRNTKNNELQSAIDAVLGQAKSASSDFSQNPFTLRTNIKDASQQARIGGAGATFSSDSAGNRQSLKDFTTNYLAADPTAKAQMEAETGALGQFYNGGVQSHLNDLQKQKALAVTGATQRALDLAQQGANAARLTHGNSSYVDKQFQDTVGGILAQHAAEMADQNRANYLTVLQGQQANAGRRAGLLDQYLQRGLTPINALNAQGNTELGQLTSLGNLTNANASYYLDNPDLAMSRRLGVLGQVGGLDTSNNFYGLTQPYGGDMRGLPPGGYRGGYPSVNPNYPLIDANMGGIIPSMGASAPPGGWPTGVRPPSTGGISPSTQPLYFTMLQDYYQNPEKYPGGLQQVQQAALTQALSPQNLYRLPINPGDTAGVDYDPGVGAGFNPDYQLMG